MIGEWHRASGEACAHLVVRVRHASRAAGDAQVETACAQRVWVELAQDESEVWRAVDRGVAERFAVGSPVLVPVAGAAGRVEAAAATPAEAEALQAIADVTSVALGRAGR
jgi:hypothetical protein